MRLCRAAAGVCCLQVQLATLRDELCQKKELLRRASDTLESLEHQYGAQLERQRQDAEDERRQLEGRLAELQLALVSAPTDQWLGRASA